MVFRIVLIIFLTFGCNRKSQVSIEKLHKAVANNHYITIKELIEDGVDINAKYGDFFLNTRGFGMTYSGLGYNIIDENDLKVGPLFNVDMGRDEDQSSDLTS